MLLKWLDEWKKTTTPLKWKVSIMNEWMAMASYSIISLLELLLKGIHCSIELSDEWFMVQMSKYNRFEQMKFNQFLI